MVWIKAKDLRLEAKVRGKRSRSPTAPLSSCHLPFAFRLLPSSYRLLPVAFCLLLLAACRPDRVQPAGYFGPTETMTQVVAQINQNNRNIPTLWTRHDFEADIVVDEHGRKEFINGDGTLMLRKPFDLMFIGDRPGMPRIVEIGSTREQYWLYAPRMVEMMWWGYYRNLGKPCVLEMPIRPDLLMEVLGVTDIETDFLAEPAPVMRFNNDADAYMFVWITQAANRLIAQKEIWYDRQTKLPKLVLLFDDDGRILLRAYLSEHQRIRTDDLPEDAQPMIATRYELFFPENGSRMFLRLRDPMLSRRGIPNQHSFPFPSPTLPPDRIIQVDENCRD